MIPYVCLGLDQAGLIQRVWGASEIIFNTPASALHQLTWEDLIRQHTNDTYQSGLRCAWTAITQQRVDPAHWPDRLPFKPGILVRIRPDVTDPPIAYVAHLFPNVEEWLKPIIGDQALEAVNRLRRLSEHLSSGVDGALTDLQIKHVHNIETHTLYLQQLLTDLYAEWIIPAVSAPLPHLLSQLLTFPDYDFPDRRITTHQLAIHYHWSSITVYGPVEIRDIVRAILRALIAGITPQTKIMLSDLNPQDAHHVQAIIRYHSYDPNLRVEQRIEPVKLTELKRPQPLRTIERLLSSAQAYLTPINGSALAEPSFTIGATAQIILTLPIWQGPI